jgi:hypothetical protein
LCDAPPALEARGERHLKRGVIMTVVEKITVHTREKWFEIEGAIDGRFDFTPALAVGLAMPLINVRVLRPV